MARVAAWTVSGATRPCKEEPAGSVERRAGELGARWRRKSGEGQLAAVENTSDGRWAALWRNREGEAGARRPGPIHKFCKSSRTSR
jgi:hypothetical protein